MNNPLQTLQNKIGIGLRSPHIKQIITEKPKIGWFEVHSENYYAKGGPAIKSLLEIRKDYPISLHSVGNSLGSSQKLDMAHLKSLKELIKIIDPFLVSDHISWGMVDGKNFNDLLPLPYNKESLKSICKNISLMQDFLQREILVENPSTYLSFINDEMDEADFVNEVTRTTGCKLLLDVNNIFVSSKNDKKFSPQKYLEKIDKKSVKEIHLAGHSKSKIFDGKKHQEILIDTHNDLVCDEVWEIYKMAIKKFGQILTLIEWDQDIPELKVLLDEAKKARKILTK
ncbi:MAG: DUF692 domain-containing protein [Rickettsiales bacterium]|nr:DUF692 domain-containing protein [Rickettsiales bacterium]